RQEPQPRTAEGKVSSFRSFQPKKEAVQLSPDSPQDQFKLPRGLEVDCRSDVEPVRDSADVVVPKRYEVATVVIKFLGAWSSAIGLVCSTHDIPNDELECAKRIRSADVNSLQSVRRRTVHVEAQVDVSR